MLFRKEQSLILWQPHFILDETTVNEAIAFITKVEELSHRPFNRFIDLSKLDAVDLNFRFVFHVALGRRLSVKNKPRMKSAFYVTSRAAERYSKLHELMTRYSPLQVALFSDRADAARWLDVPRKALAIS